MSGVRSDPQRGHSGSSRQGTRQVGHLIVLRRGLMREHEYKVAYGNDVSKITVEV